MLQCVCPRAACPNIPRDNNPFATLKPTDIWCYLEPRIYLVNELNLLRGDLAKRLLNLETPRGKPMRLPQTLREIRPFGRPQLGLPCLMEATH